MRVHFRAVDGMTSETSFIAAEPFFAVFGAAWVGIAEGSICLGLVVEVRSLPSGDSARILPGWDLFSCLGIAGR